MAYVDANFAPPFDNNLALSTFGLPSYVDPANMDFHLSPGSPLIHAGIAITDPNWPFTPATPNLGIYQ